MCCTKNCIMVGASCFMTCIAGLPLCFITVLLCSVMLDLELLLTPNLALKIQFTGFFFTCHHNQTHYTMELQQILFQSILFASLPTMFFLANLKCFLLDFFLHKRLVFVVSPELCLLRHLWVTIKPLWLPQQPWDLQNPHPTSP